MSTVINPYLSPLPNLAIVIVRYYVSHQVLERWVETLKATWSNQVYCPQVVLIDLKGDPQRAGWHASKDTFLDMSGYQHGLTLLAPADVYLVLNDTTFTKHPWRLLFGCLYDWVRYVQTAGRPVVAGVVHPSTDVLVGSVGHRHLSTFCMLMNPQALSLLQALLSQMPSELPATEWIVQQTEQDDFLSVLLDLHLFGVRNPWSWPAKQHASSELLQRKAVTVTIEHQFTQQLLQHSGYVLPVNLTLRYRLMAVLQRFWWARR